MTQTKEEMIKDLSILHTMIDKEKKDLEKAIKEWTNNLHENYATERNIESDITDIKQFLEFKIPDILLQEDLIHVSGIKNLLEDREENLISIKIRISHAIEILEFLRKDDNEVIFNLEEEIEWYEKEIKKLGD